MKKIFLVVISMFVTASAFANLFSCHNIYIDGFGGLNFLQSQKENGMKVKLNTGYAVGGALGYRFSRFFRIEGEAAYRLNTFDEVVVQNMHFSASGDFKKVTAMANGIVELPFFGNWFTPYCGIGFGKGWDKQNFTLDPITTSEGTFVFEEIVSRDRGFVYQGIVGVTHCVGPNLQAGLEYRFLDGSCTQANHTANLNLRIYF